jgi:hypothetical protein
MYGHEPGFRKDHGPIRYHEVNVDFRKPRYCAGDFRSEKPQIGGLVRWMTGSSSTGVALYYMRRGHAGGLQTAVESRRPVSVGRMIHLRHLDLIFPGPCTYLNEGAHVMACTRRAIPGGKIVFACARSVGRKFSDLNIPLQPGDRQVDAACYRQSDFGLRPHISGNIPSLAKDRQERPKVGSHGCFTRRTWI